jgi:hypothetical protein
MQGNIGTFYNGLDGKDRKHTSMSDSGIRDALVSRYTNIRLIPNNGGRCT